MNLAMWFYAIDVADSLRWFFCVLLIMSLVGTIIGIIFMFSMADQQSAGDKEWLAWRKCMTFAVSVFVPSLLCTILIPSAKTLYMIMGAETAQEIVRNPKIQETGGKVLELINRKLEALLDAEKPKEK